MEMLEPFVIVQFEHCGFTADRHLIGTLKSFNSLVGRLVCNLICHVLVNES